MCNEIKDEENHVWTCPECGNQVIWQYLDLVMVGEPVCIVCDTDMEWDGMA